VARGRFHLTFPPKLVDEPIIHRLGTDFGLMTNIKRANINERIAWLILELDGEDRSLEEALAWLAEQGVQVDRLEDESPS
jgi:L-aspartate semialdehyde sulfurtransferase ferredoxin